MRTVPERSAIFSFITLLAGFLSGPLIGAWFGQTLAPDSELSQIATLLVFPAVFVIGMMFWLGLAVATVVIGGIVGLFRGRMPWSGPRVGAGRVEVPPGYWVFPVLAVVLAGGAGVVQALLTETALLTALGAHLVVGGGYGGALWLAAHLGYLPFPEPE